MVVCTQWRIQYGKSPPPPPPPPTHTHTPPCEGAILLIKILKFSARPRSAYKTHENMHILLAFIINSPETKANQSL